MSIVSCKKGGFKSDIEKVTCQEWHVAFFFGTFLAQNLQNTGLVKVFY